MESNHLEKDSLAEEKSGIKNIKSAVFPYEFENAYQLMENFWKDVNSIIDSEVKK